jgi:hypothetical protein
MIEFYRHSYYGYSYSQDKCEGTYYSNVPHNNMLEEYSELCAKYITLPREEKIKVQIAKYYVWKLEITLIKKLLTSKKINDLEKLLLEDQQNLLRKEAGKCREEMHRLYHNELPQNYPEVYKFMEKIEGYVSLEAPVTKRNIDLEKYITLSPMDRIRLLASQSKILEIEKDALARRRESHKIDEYEKLFLNYRIKILSECIEIISKSITLTFAKGFTRDSPELKEFYREIGRISYSDWKFKGKEYYRYPYDFKRPNEVPPDEWGSPDINWKTGSRI